MIKKVRKAVFPVGGLGTRFLPATKAMPKEMLPVVDKPLIQYAVDEAREAGIEEFIFVTGRGKVLIEDHFDRSYELERALSDRGKNDILEKITDGLPDIGSVAYTRQREPLGLGHAVWCAQRFVGDEPFAVILADDLILSDTPCLKQLIDVRNENRGNVNVVAMMEVDNKDTSKYGIINPKTSDTENVEILDFVEKPAPKDAPSNLAVVGRYILEPIIFDILKNQQRGAGNEIQLTDALSKSIRYNTFIGQAFEGKRFDCGDKLGFLHANLAFGLAREDIGNEFKEIVKNINNNI